MASCNIQASEQTHHGQKGAMALDICLSGRAELCAAQERAPLLSVIAVTWNAKKYVDACLGSLDHVADIPMEVIVVDNASTDGTAELIAREFRDFKLFRNDQNLGFAKANNIGIGHSRGRYVCLVN